MKTKGRKRTSRHIPLLYRALATPALRGFGLIEIAFALIIIGILASIGLPLLKVTLLQQKETLTHQRQEQALKIIAAFALKNDRLPCPSPSNGQQQDLGKESFSTKIQGCSLKRGILPYKTLGISEEMAQDGWRRLMTYAVDLTYTLQRTFHNVTPFSVWKSTFCQATHSPLHVLHKSLLQEESVTDEKRDNPILCVIISHGPKGSGAPGNSRTHVSDPNELINADQSDTFIAKAPQPFAHIVKWVSRDAFTALYMEQPCRQERSRKPPRLEGEIP